MRKSYFLAPKWGVDLYVGSTYTRVNTVLVVTFHGFRGGAEDYTPYSKMATILVLFCFLAN